MAVQVWIGEKPDNPNERKAIIGLANGLDRLEGLYVMLANFSVGGRAVDLVILKSRRDLYSGAETLRRPGIRLGQRHLESRQPQRLDQAAQSRTQEPIRPGSFVLL